MHNQALPFPNKAMRAQQLDWLGLIMTYLGIYIVPVDSKETVKTLNQHLEEIMKLMNTNKLKLILDKAVSVGLFLAGDDTTLQDFRSQLGCSPGIRDGP